MNLFLTYPSCKYKEIRTSYFLGVFVVVNPLEFILLFSDSIKLT